MVRALCFHGYFRVVGASGEGRRLEAHDGPVLHLIQSGETLIGADDAHKCLCIRLGEADLSAFAAEVLNKALDALCQQSTLDRLSDAFSHPEVVGVVLPPREPVARAS